MAVNVIDFVTSLIYGNPGGGAKNHLNWTLDRLASPPPANSRGDDFIAHHLDVMLNRYESWRRTNTLPPIRPSDGSDVLVPEQGRFAVSKRKPNTVELEAPVFEGFVEDDVGFELRRAKPNGRSCAYRRPFAARAMARRV
jgi:hypothetical protein